MFSCCLVVPMSLFMLLGPMVAAGKGLRSFLKVAGLELLLVLGCLLVDLRGSIDLFSHPSDNAVVIGIFCCVLLFPLIMGAIVLYVREMEAIPLIKKCRKCGYDLRFSPVRCPECGTPVKVDPDRF